MKLNYEEKKALLENFKCRMLKIESVIGDIKFYEKNNEKASEDRKKNNSAYINNTKEKDKEIGEEEKIKFPYELKSYFENGSFDNVKVNKDELIEMIKKHKHKNSLSVHICAIKIILQQISKDFLYDIYNHYNDLYIYIHSNSNSIVDLYNTFEYKKNIIFSHLDFMKNYSSKITEIMDLKENINSYKISETDVYFDRLNKIENRNELLFSKIASINSCLEKISYKYGIMIQLASIIISKYKLNIS